MEDSPNRSTRPDWASYLHELTNQKKREMKKDLVLKSSFSTKEKRKCHNTLLLT